MLDRNPSISGRTWSDRNWHWMIDCYLGAHRTTNAVLFSLKKGDRWLCWWWWWWQYKKNRTNTYRFDVHVSFELHGHIRFCGSFIRNKTTSTKCCLTQWVSKLPWNCGIHGVRPYMVNSPSLASVVNTIVYKIEPIFTGLGHGKLSWFLTLWWWWSWWRWRWWWWWWCRWYFYYYCYHHHHHNHRHHHHHHPHPHHYCCCFYYYYYCYYWCYYYYYFYHFDIINIIIFIIIIVMETITITMTIIIICLTCHEHFVSVSEIFLKHDFILCLYYVLQKQND